jgi:hypothetical protein
VTAYSAVRGVGAFARDEIPFLHQEIEPWRPPTPRANITTRQLLTTKAPPITIARLRTIITMGVMTKPRSTLRRPANTVPRRLGIPRPPMNIRKSSANT